ncbi:hypothetical protein [Aeribacillus pallidus]|jgi:diketogulonate reductase-like aldo/keto reductase|uniref:hypothetical protein n=1 Tax=Aeribacillus pallidus TaxID=33936 RepID=UPI001D89B231|nr:hypothetical protein [Bacillus sp. (in: firmicutes)]
MKRTEDYLTPAAKKEQITIQAYDPLEEPKNIAGDSVDEHKNLEKANAIIGEDEIKQQNENL